MLAVVGTLFGIIVGAGLAFLRDRAQWSRDDALRWHEMKFKGYEAFLTAAREAHRTGAIVAVSISSWDRDPEHEPKDFETRGWEEHQAAHDRLRAQRGTLELVGSPDANAAARDLQEALDDEMKAHLAAIATIPDTPEGRMTVGEYRRRGLPMPKLPRPDPKAVAEQKEAIRRLFGAFDSFIDAARRDLKGAGTNAKGGRIKRWFSSR